MFEVVLDIEDRDELLAALQATLAAQEAETQEAYRYTPGDSASGICSQCAPYVDMVTDGMGSNGVPVPPLHLNCVCTLTPVALDELASEEAEPLSHLKALNTQELTRVVGKRRAAAVASGKVSIEDLYDEVGLLRPLSELGI